MDLIKCPRCGEEYSSSYPSCPFCEEDGAKPRKLRLNRTRRVTDQKKAQSARGGMIVVLVLVLALLSWYLFGDRIVERSRTPDEPDGSQVEQQGPDVPAINPNDDPFYEPASPEDEPPGGENVEPVEPAPPEDEPPAEEDIDVSNAKLSREDFTLSGSGDSWTLKVSGTEASPHWSIDNANVATIEADGTVKAVANGTTTVRCKVGTRELTCIVRVTNTGRTAAPADAPTSAEPVEPTPPAAPGTSPGSAAPASVDVSSLSVKTNYGTMLQKDPGTGYPDCTVRIGGDPIRLIVVGADGEEVNATWKSNDTSLLTIAENGQLAPVKQGNATVTATVGGASVTCIIRVRQ